MIHACASYISIYIYNQSHTRDRQHRARRLDSGAVSDWTRTHLALLIVIKCVYYHY